MRGYSSHWCDQHPPHPNLPPQMTKEQAVRAAEELLKLSKAADEMMALGPVGGSTRTLRAEELVSWVRKAWA